MSSAESWRGSSLLVALAVCTAVCSVVILLRNHRLMEFIELAAYDAFLQQQPGLTTHDPRIVFVEVFEEDIRKQERWPMPDAVVARVLRNILNCGPRVVGLDIYRDIPVSPGTEELHALFQECHRVVTVMKFPDEHSCGVARPFMATDVHPVGFNDLLLDKDGVARRATLFLDDGTSAFSSFALVITLLYLEKDGITVGSDPVDPQFMRLGRTTFVPLTSDDGGYIGLDDRGYQFLMDYPSAQAPAVSIPFSDILDGRFDPNLLKDRIVLIGADAESTKDFFYSPLSGRMTGRARLPGVRIHGCIVRQLLNCALEGRSPMAFIKESWEWAWIILWAVSGAALAIAVRTFWRFLMAIPGLFILLAAVCYAFFRQGVWIPIVPPALTLLASSGLMIAHFSHQERLQKALLMQLFSSHVSKGFAEAIWSQRAQFMKGGRPSPQELTATVFFTDLKGFTSIAEAMDAASLFDWLNEYMDVMSRAVMEHGGIINKYIGDAIMGLFGVPIARTTEAEIREDAVSAVKCAAAMARAMADLNAGWTAAGRPVVKMRIGIYTGPLVVGCVGSSERLEYTVIGDTVNIASRLESFDKDFDADNPCRILVGNTTRDYLGDDFQAARVGTVSLKGKSLPVEVFQVRPSEDSI